MSDDNGLTKILSKDVYKRQTLKNGGYLLKKNGETDNELLARAILLAQNRIKERDSRISALEKENNLSLIHI